MHRKLKMEALHDWIQTYSGEKFYPTNPTVASVHLEDIAHALSLQTRFTGHVREFYSVAQHSILVTRVAMQMVPANAFQEDEERTWRIMREAFLHDASEAYLCDVARPIKRMPLMAAYRECEDNLMACIAQRFNFTWPMSIIVRDADNVVLLAEKRDLLTADIPWESKFGITDEDVNKYVPYTIDPLSPQMAEALFKSMAVNLLQIK